jgi:hypothetical protein
VVNKISKCSTIRVVRSGTLLVSDFVRGTGPDSTIIYRVTNFGRSPEISQILLLH